MTVISTTTDEDALTLTLVCEFAAAPERVWQVWSDPRQLERWWGPPTWPATFEEHDLRPGGSVTYYMTGPEGEKSRGWWEVRTVDAPRSLSFEDGFADESGDRSTTMPTTTAEVRLEPVGDGTRMTVVSQFATLDELQQLVRMGMVEGLTLAAGQIDDVLAS